MPGFITHSIFSEKVFEKLSDSNLKATIRKYPEVFKLGAQGPDIFFYNPLCHLLNGYRNTGVHMHENKTNLFFSNGFKLISALEDPMYKEICLTYLCGFITHYYLDKKAHPYINWYTFKLKGNADDNSFRIHSGIETNIDGAYLKKYKQVLPCNISHQRMIGITKTELDAVADFMHLALTRTYLPVNKRKTFCFAPAYIRFSIRCTQIGRRLVIDKYGWKKKIVDCIEKHLLPNPLLGGMIVCNSQEGYGDYMNLSHQYWTNPWDTDSRSKASFPELFKQAADTCAQTLSVIHDNNFESLLTELENHSYHSGLAL